MTAMSEYGGGETVGHHFGRRIVEIKHKTKATLTDVEHST
ncbi:DUF3140 domain-containing protein [Endobacterium cereale]|jgi:hypothetical protein|nr:DUF3140 domain-containing protein [Endobacterium cereale]MEB2848493.1 DUF3140 domain-containing protein [Endobacterium cereale]